MWVITLNLFDGINFYCGKVYHNGAWLPSWDTDKRYAFIYTDKMEAERECGILQQFQTSHDCRIELFEKFSRN